MAEWFVEKSVLKRYSDPGCTAVVSSDRDWLKEAACQGEGALAQNCSCPCPIKWILCNSNEARGAEVKEDKRDRR